MELDSADGESSGSGPCFPAKDPPEVHFGVATEFRLVQRVDEGIEGRWQVIQFAQNWVRIHSAPMMDEECEKVAAKEENGDYQRHFEDAL